jgi:aryl-alcohol dehydrogenase-like predicted oxidoreductase
MPMVELLQQWGKMKEGTPAQTSLAWLLAKRPWIIPIPGTINSEHLEENLRTAAVKFSVDELKKFENAALSNVITGNSLRPGQLVQLNNMQRNSIPCSNKD